MKGSIVRRIDEIVKRTQEPELVDVAFQTFRDNTPVRNGNARRRTRKRQDEIHANYPYAKRLDEGYSKQSPDGMTKPTIEAVRKHIREKV